MDKGLIWDKGLNSKHITLTSVMLLVLFSLPSNSEKMSEDFNTLFTNGRKKSLKKKKKKVKWDVQCPGYSSSKILTGQ